MACQAGALVRSDQPVAEALAARAGPLQLLLPLACSAAACGRPCTKWVLLMHALMGKVSAPNFEDLLALERLLRHIQGAGYSHQAVRPCKRPALSAFLDQASDLCIQTERTAASREHQTGAGVQRGGAHAAAGRGGRARSGAQARPHVARCGPAQGRTPCTAAAALGKNTTSALQIPCIAC